MANGLDWRTVDWLHEVDDGEVILIAHNRGTWRHEDERAAIAAGANIVVQILGVPPINPMSVYVSEVPEPG